MRDHLLNVYGESEANEKNTSNCDPDILLQQSVSGIQKIMYLWHLSDCFENFQCVLSLSVHPEALFNNVCALGDLLPFRTHL